MGEARSGREQTVDVAVIGAGTAGLNARRAAEKAGAHAIVIDGGPLGTTCARVGCMPSKLLIAAAEAAQAIREAPQFGVHAGAPRVVAPEVFARVRRERDRFAGFVIEDSLELERRGLLIRGQARFVGPQTLQVGADLRVTARRAIVLASGSAPYVPPELAGLGPRVIDSEAVFELDAIPERALVVGAGPIGLELGQALARLGAQVTVLGRSGGLAGLHDPEVIAAARAALAEELALHTRARLEAAEAGEDGVRARFVGDDGELHEGTWPLVLVAAGRRPRLAALQPEQAGLAVDAQGRALGLDPATLQWGAAPVFVAGDAAGVRPILHEAIDEGQIAGRNAAAYPAVMPGQRRTPLAIVFTAPQIAAVGARLDALGPNTCAIGQVDFGSQGRARVMGKDRGLLRVYAARTSGTLLGAEMVGPAAEHLGHLLAWAIQRETTVEQALQLPFYHPVIEEGLRTALQELRRNLAQGTG